MLLLGILGRLLERTHLSSRRSRMHRYMLLLNRDISFIHRKHLCLSQTSVPRHHKSTFVSTTLKDHTIWTSMFNILTLADHQWEHRRYNSTCKTSDCRPDTRLEANGQGIPSM